MLSVDYTMPIEPLRARLHEILAASPVWDGKVWNLQVVESIDRTLRLRALVSASDAGKSWDLRCHVREQLVAFLCEHYPEHLPRSRADVRAEAPVAAPSGVSLPPAR